MNPAIPSVSQALVVALNSAVRDNLVESLRAVGMAIVCTEYVDECIGTVPAGPALVVLHADSFRFDQIVGILFALRRERPDAHTVLVTEAPDRYEKLIVTADNASSPSVIPMPVLARTIFDIASAGRPSRLLNATTTKDLGGRGEAMALFDTCLGASRNAG